MNAEPAHAPGPASRDEAATLEFRSATKRYPGQSAPAVDGLSLELAAGEIHQALGIGPFTPESLAMVQEENAKLRATDA